MIYLTKHCRSILRHIFILLALAGSVGVLGVRADSPAQSSGGPPKWTVQTMSDGRVMSGAPAIVSDQAGGVHMFWPQAGLGEQRGTMFYATRKDDAVWAVNDVIVGNIQTPMVTLDKKGTLHLTYSEEGVIKYTQAPIPLAGTVRGWTRPIPISDWPSYTPNLHYDSRGILHLTYSYIYETSALYYVRSEDGGQTWTTPSLIDAPPADAAINRPQMAEGSDGTLHLVWSYTPMSKLYGGMGIYYAQSTDAGKTWSNPMRIDETTPGLLGKEAWYVSLAVIGSSELHVVWDAHGEGGQRYYQLSQDGGRTWTPARRVWGSFVYQTGPSPMIQDSAGKLYLFASGAFEFSQRQGVYFSTWTGSEWTNPELVDISSLGPEYLRVALTGGNTFHLVWLERGTDPQNAWYATARTAAPYVAPTEYDWSGIEPTALPGASAGVLAGAAGPEAGATVGPTSTPRPSLFNQPVPNTGLDVQALGDVKTARTPQSSLWVSALAVGLFVLAVIAFQLVTTQGRRR